MQVEALNFINGLDVGGDALIDGPAIKTSTKPDTEKLDTGRHAHEDIEWQLSNLEIVFYILDAKSLEKTAKRIIGPSKRGVNFHLYFAGVFFGPQNDATGMRGSGFLGHGPF